MAKLINGNGNPAIYAAEDADWFAAIMGNQTSITGIGEQFRADQADANTVEVFDGVIITKEGRRIQLDANAVDLFEIPTGVPGTTSYYIIGYHLYNDENSNQFCEVFTQKMDTASETIPEDTFRGGADEVFVSLYRVTQDGLTITDIDLLLPTIGSIKEAEELSEDKIGTESGTIGSYNTQTIEKISYDNTNKKLILKVNGADTPVPFSSGEANFIGTQTATINRTGGGGTNTTSEITISNNGKYLVCVSASAGSQRSYMGNGSSVLYKNNTNILSKTGGLVRGSGDSDYSYCNYSKLIDCVVGDKIKTSFSYTTHATYPSTGLVQLDIWKVG